MNSDDEDNPFDATMLGGSQTSTTKALLVFIHVPKVLRVHIAKGDSETRVKSLERKESTDDPILEAKPAHKKTPSTAASKPGHRKTNSMSKSSKPGHRKTGSFASTRNEVPMVPLDTTSSRTITPTSPTESSEILKKSNSLDVEDETPGEHEIGYVEAEDSKDEKNKKQPVIEHVITAEEMAAVVNLEMEDDAPEEGKVWDAAPAKEETKKEEAPAEPASLTSAMKTFFGIVTNKEDEVTSRLGREEAIRIVKAQTSLATLPVQKEEEEEKGPAPNTEIKVQALLQLTCKNLFKEGCFFSAPATIDITKGEGEWIQFTIMCKPQSIDLVLERLERIGVGSSVGMISVYKSELLKTADWPKLTDETTTKKKEEKKASVVKRKVSTQSGDEGVTTVDDVKQEWKNAASRMRVEQIKEQIHEQAAMSFDFLALLLIASILAGVGLITNSTVVIVASMLVSPIMGPVMGITFGSRVFDWKLARASAAVEVGALLIAVLTGAVVGFASAFSQYADDWPTEEMSSRGDVGGLITGIAIAIPSGMGVALSILGNNTSSLVGVAISASLLPPAVNAGICWAHAILIRAGAVSNDEDFITIGAISFALTLVNILCIWVFGIVMFTIKEVAPSEKKSAFWARDIKVARATQKRGSLKKDVDLETIKAGLQEALEQKRNEEGNVTGAKVKNLRRWRRRNQPRDYSFSLRDDQADDDVDFLEFFMMGLNPIMEDTQGLDPKDRAAYLGFRSSVQDFAVEEEVVPERPAWLSFFGR
mmetsp:Transcript_37720/g.91634  ORF Transcript_37720/g.91634 Transcript_37720/m.91634 type:complete len:763 (+) Transcript_37720:42-2330(+)